MEKRILGRTGLEVSALGYGVAWVSRLGGVAREDARRAVRRALELGITHFDTAPSYADSEEVLGYALAGVPADSYSVSTKVGGRPQPFDPRDKAALRRSVEESLRLLKRDYVDILMVHEPDRPGQYDWWSDWDNLRGPVDEVLDELKAAGLIRFTGLGGTTVHELALLVDTGRFDVVLTAFNYALLWREAAIEVLPAARRHGVGVIAGSPLHQGSLSQRHDAEIESGARWLNAPRREQLKRLYAFVDEVDIPLQEMAMRFVISNPDIGLMLTGARSVAEVEANVASVEKGPLPADILQCLQEIADMVPFRPYCEPMVLPFGRPYVGPGPGGAGVKWAGPQWPGSR
ncbi:MAG: aldo/keto reductase [Chloroflexi bacterium]|nr:aldo/keto reductase [Chloroflexota bacterium]